ncbi:MAG: M23 family metallopeptidase [Anaerolineales bacterium]|nr:M23 family metallopeptidase [Anaerolineales bacterium]
MTRLIIVVLLVGFYDSGVKPAQNVYAYSAVSERPVFLAWPLPSYVGVARISQFPNTPWTWNYLGLNPGQQCPPAFGYLLNAEFWSVWKDTSLPEEQDMAKADPHNFEMVNCYSTLGPAGENGHEATDIKAPAGTPTYASADGKVAGWRFAEVNTMVVLKHCLGGQWDVDGNCAGGRKWYTTYMHIIPDDNLLQMEKDVTEGTQVGTIYNQGDNSHLHFEVGVDQRSYFNYVNPWGRDEPPWVGCMWKDQSLCIQSNLGYRRVGIVAQSGRFFVQDDNLTFAEIFGVDEVKQFKMAGHRIAVMDKEGYLFARDVEFKRVVPFSYDFVLNWVNIGNDFVNYQITENRIALLDTDGVLKIKEGELSGEWALQVDNVLSYSISKHRLGILTTTGELKVKEGGLNTDWIHIASNVKDFQLLDSRIAVVDLQNNLFVQEGALTNEWKPMGTKIQAFQLSGTRIAVMDSLGKLMVNDGNLRAAWVLQAENIQRFQLADNRIVIQDKDGKWKIKIGDLYQPWKDFAGFSAQDIKLNGELLVMLE